MKDDSEPAFPESGLSGLPNGEFIYGRSGMSLRDYFAAHALVGLTSDPSECVPCLDQKNPLPEQMKYAGYIAEASYRIADAMLKERTK